MSKLALLPNTERTEIGYTARHADSFYVWKELPDKTPRRAGKLCDKMHELCLAMQTLGFLQLGRDEFAEPLGKLKIREPKVKGPRASDTRARDGHKCYSIGSQEGSNT